VGRVKWGVGRAVGNDGEMVESEGEGVKGRKG